jgi:hypothetical protein
VTLYDDGTKRVNMSTWDLCGRAIANLVKLPDDGELALQDWSNKGLYISSFLISQRDILDSLHRVLGTSDADWNVSYQPTQERYDEGKRELAAGQRTGFAKAMYARIFFPNGRGDYETGWGVDNEKLGIEKEDLDEATRRAVGMVAGGFGWKG